MYGGVLSNRRAGAFSLVLSTYAGGLGHTCTRRRNSRRYSGFCVNRHATKLIPNTDPCAFLPQIELYSWSYFYALPKAESHKITLPYTFLARSKAHIGSSLHRHFKISSSVARAIIMVLFACPGDINRPFGGGSIQGHGRRSTIPSHL